jgi:hypothetical protein
MFELTMLQVLQAEREQEVAADLRRRQILKGAGQSASLTTVDTTPTTDRRAAAVRVRALGR